MTMKLVILLTVALFSTHVVLVSSFKDLTMVTRNAGLTNWMQLPRDYRLAAVIRQLKYLDSDLICLQGVWFQPDLEEILTKMNETHPYSASSAGTVQRAPDTPICSDITDLLNCIESFCNDSVINTTTSGRDVYRCTLNNCSPEIMGLTAECRLCLLYATNETTLYGSDICFEPTNDTMNMYGLLFLSKKNIKMSSLHLFDNDTDINDLVDPRGFLEITFKRIDGVTICTQLSEEIFGLPVYEPNLPGYNTTDERNKAQIKQLLSHTALIEYVMMLGSFNSGPKFQCKTKVQNKANYKKFIKVMPPFAASIVHRCTYCLGPEKVAVDHVFIRGYFLRYSNRVFRDESIAYHSGMNAYVLNP